MRPSLKKAIGKIHLWLGLASGLVVFVIAITGCVYAFQEEIQNATQSYRFVEAQNKNFLPPSAFVQAAGKMLPAEKPHSVTYGAKDEAARVTFYRENFYYIVYLNPYSSEVLEVKDVSSSFFSWILDGHFYLWLPDDIGKPVVAIATLIFVVLMISGLILWWPRNKAAAKQRFWFRWRESTKWKRKNYDLHNILGFYAMWIGIIIALTGLVWGFQWFAKSAYWLTSGGEEMVEYYEPLSDTSVLASYDTVPYDVLWRKLSAENPSAQSMEVHVPETDSSAINIGINPDSDTYWKTDYRYFDQYTLKEMEVAHTWGKFENASVASKIQRMNYDVHVGAIAGLAGKTLAFFISLLIASFPVTGFMIWWGRKKATAS
ncbi:MAG: PepSY-associated TM helix domain-containing protein [Flavobacteriales bacterium]